MICTILLTALPLASDGSIPSAPPIRVRAAPADVVLLWNETALLAIRAERTPPPQAARNLAMLHIAMYDAVNAIGRTHDHFLVNAVPPASTSPESSAAVAAHRVLVALYPGQRERFDAALRQSLSAIPDCPGKEEGGTLGKFVAEQVLAWRKDDGSGRRVAYRPSDEAGKWQPTLPGYRPALLPQWPQVKTFALRSLDQIRPTPPPSLTSREYTRAYHEVKELGAAGSSVRSPEETEIAYFWADGDGTVTPPGHWNRIAQTVARSHGNTLTENARLFALLNVALADASIACWDCKFKFNVWRPVQAIREADRDANPATAPETTWTPLLPTPPFPAYTSGHSTFSSTAATVLAEFYASDAFRFTSTSEGLPGIERTYTSFSSAAAEAGRSRVYGGIHWSFDDAQGQAAGRFIGRYVTRHYMQPRAGRATAP